MSFEIFMILKFDNLLRIFCTCPEGFYLVLLTEYLWKILSSCCFRFLKNVGLIQNQIALKHLPCFFHKKIIM